MEKTPIIMKLQDVHQLLRSPPPKIEPSAPRLPHISRKLLGILDMEGKINQRTLAKHLYISPQAVSENVKKLEKLELIQREGGLQKNENYLSLTEKGATLAKVLEREIKGRHDQIFYGFSDEEAEELDRLLLKMIDNLQPQPE